LGHSPINDTLDGLIVGGSKFTRLDDLAFLYDGSVTDTWDQLEEILLMPGGAKAARAKRIMDNDGKDKVLTAHNTMNFKPSQFNS
jgi:hypothetical protein